MRVLIETLTITRVRCDLVLSQSKKERFLLPRKSVNRRLSSVTHLVPAKFIRGDQISNTQLVSSFRHVVREGGRV